MANKKIRSLKWFRYRPILNRGILFTRDNIRIDRDIDYDSEIALAYVEVWFDAEQKFGIRLLDGDYVNVYAHIIPDTCDLQLNYTICNADGSIYNEYVYTDITEKEKDLIRVMTDEISLKETGMTVYQNWSRLKNQD